MTKLPPLLLSLFITPGLFAQAKTERSQACWLETSTSPRDGALGGAGLEHTTVWNSTISAVLIRNPHGDVLIDTGLGPDAELQMNELPPAGRTFGMQVVAGAKARVPVAELLSRVGEKPDQVAAIVLTHTHYDHLGGATELNAPINIPQSEVDWELAQAAHPTITPPSLVNATKARFRVLSYDSGYFLGFSKSKDLYGDGSIVVVPLPGHTPGSQGVIARLGTGRVFFIGDAADTLEAAERGLPKSSMLRSATDADPALADQTTKHIAAFHLRYPHIDLIPAHDRQAYLAVFTAPSTCVSSLPIAHAANKRLR